MLKKAISSLRKKEVIVYPTETVYGLGADAFSKKAIKKVFKKKNRPSTKPISIAVSNWEMINKVAYINKEEENVIKKILPGPVTFLVEKKPKVPDILVSGRKKIGIRYPDNWVALKLIDKFDSPITSTSANITGDKPPRSFFEIDIDVETKLFGGKSKYDVPSTVYDLENDEIIRRGPITNSMIRKAKWN